MKGAPPKSFIHRATAACCACCMARIVASGADVACALTLFPIESTPVPPEPPEFPLPVAFFPPLMLSLFSVSLCGFSLVVEEDMVCNIAFASMVA